MIPYKNFIKRADFGGQIGENKEESFIKYIIYVSQVGTLIWACT